MQSAIEYIQSKINGFQPSTGLVLGSGLGFFADDRMKETIVIPYGEIPNFPRSTVEGHKGQFVFGQVDGATGWSVCRGVSIITRATR